MWIDSEGNMILDTEDEYLLLLYKHAVPMARHAVMTILKQWQAGEEAHQEAEEEAQRRADREADRRAGRAGPQQGPGDIIRIRDAQRRREQK